MRPFIDGVTLIMWAWATWWIPLLILFGVWKHGVLRLPITYTPMLWSLVFPLGMYALASLRLSLASDFPPLRAVSLAMVWIALAAWAATAAGLVMTFWRSWRAEAAAHILNTPNLVSGTGALSAAENASASTRRVSLGAMMPSSHSRAVA